MIARTNFKHLTGLFMLAPLIIGAISTGGCIQSGTDIAGTQIIRDITPVQAFAFIGENQSDPDFILLDIRTPEEFSAERLEDAVNLVDYYSETFRQDLDKLDKSKTYLIYCRTGRRTGEALTIMKDLGFSEVYNMLGGITGWAEEGLITIK